MRLERITTDVWRISLWPCEGSPQNALEQARPMSPRGAADAPAELAPTGYPT
jgi:hypothetical protein